MASVTHINGTTMGNYRRAQVPGGVFFFTVVTYRRQPILTLSGIRLALRGALQKTRQRRPFVIDAMVILPDHLHCIWRLPEGDSDFSSRWREIKKATTRTVASTSTEFHRSHVWQARFWEHAIRDEADWQRHVDYIHYNPVKHGYVPDPGDWAWSSFHRFRARGYYANDWGFCVPDNIAGMQME